MLPIISQTDRPGVGVNLARAPDSTLGLGVTMPSIGLAPLLPVTSRTVRSSKIVVFLRIARMQRLTSGRSGTNTLVNWSAREGTKE